MPRPYRRCRAQRIGCEDRRQEEKALTEEQLQQIQQIQQINQDQIEQRLNQIEQRLNQSEQRLNQIEQITAACQNCAPKVQAIIGAGGGAGGGSVSGGGAGGGPKVRSQITRD